MPSLRETSLKGGGETRGNRTLLEKLGLSILSATQREMEDAKLGEMKHYQRNWIMAKLSKASLHKPAQEHSTGCSSRRTICPTICRDSKGVEPTKVQQRQQNMLSASLCDLGSYVHEEIRWVSILSIDCGGLWWTDLQVKGVSPPSWCCRFRTCRIALSCRLPS